MPCFAWAQQQSVKVTVQAVPAANPFGHAVVQVGTGDKVGLVPNSDAAAAGAVLKEAASVSGSTNGTVVPSAVPGHVEPLAPGRDQKGTTTAVIEVTPNQGQAMLNYINTARGNPQQYDPGFRNCANFVEEVLHAGGVNAPNDMTPGALVRDLNQQASH